MGHDTGDDAAVWQRPDGRALVATADFFTPIVDDPVTWGRIAAANAVSDVYAMGGTPLFGLNLVAWPRDVLDLELLAKVHDGGSAVAAEGGWAVAGGHTVDGPEPMYGMSMVGEVDPDIMLTNAGLETGQILILTKPLGTGLLATAVKRSEPASIAVGGDLHEIYTTGVAEMTRLNAAAARVAVDVGSKGATDVTGFGLLGHLHRMLGASAQNAELDPAAIPLLPGARQLLDDGFIPGGTMRNVEYVQPHIAGEPDEDDVILLADAQTSGGLLFGCDPATVDEALAKLASTGHTAAAIGTVTPPADIVGQISL